VQTAWAKNKLKRRRHMRDGRHFLPGVDREELRREVEEFMR